MEDRLLQMNDGGAAFQKRLSSPGVFRAYMLVKAPVLGVTGASLESIDTHGARMALPFSKRTKNLFGNMFGSAIIASAETTSASMLVLHIRNQSAKLTAELVGIDFQALEQANEPLRIFAHEGLRYAEFVELAATSGKSEEESFEVTAATQGGKTTHRMKLTWRLVAKH